MKNTVPYDTISINSKTEPIFRKCCFSFPLRTGCFILGYINMIFNTFHTLALIMFTTNFGITTHGFEHFDFGYSNFDEDLPKPPEIFEKSYFRQIEIMLIIGVCANVLWLMINIACLVGLHKRRPGPIKVYIAFASARLALSFTGFLYLTLTITAFPHTFLIYTIDFGMSAYFILVYYMYAMQLSQDNLAPVMVQKEPVQINSEVKIKPSEEKIENVIISPINAEKTCLV